MAQPLPTLAPPLSGPWLLDEDDLPESTLHDEVIELLKLILKYWTTSSGLDALVARNLACRWIATDARIGIDPDLMLVVPAPPLPAGKLALKQLRTWEPGHAPPQLTIEVVSEWTAAKDYVEAPYAHAAAGSQELWVFDPELHGPLTTGGPFLLQVWRRQPSGTMARVHAGGGPCWSEMLQAWVVLTERGTRLRVAHDRAGRQLWPTATEAAETAREESRRTQREDSAARAVAEAAAAAAEAAQREQSQRAEEQSQRAEEQSQRAEEQARRATAAEAEVAELRRQLEALRANRPT